eukprot:437558-Rhodomonas_salina.1
MTSRESTRSSTWAYHHSAPQYRHPTADNPRQYSRLYQDTWSHLTWSKLYTTPTAAANAGIIFIPRLINSGSVISRIESDPAKSNSRAFNALRPVPELEGV